MTWLIVSAAGALVMVGSAWLHGLATGRGQMRPCENCGTTRAPREHRGIAEMWVCTDQDGCTHRTESARARGC